jgi:hypothetical protein
MVEVGAGECVVVALASRRLCLCRGRSLRKRDAGWSVYSWSFGRLQSGYRGGQQRSQQHNDQEVLPERRTIALLGTAIVVMEQSHDRHLCRQSSHLAMAWLLSAGSQVIWVLAMRPSRPDRRAMLGTTRCDAA